MRFVLKQVVRMKEKAITTAIATIIATAMAAEKIKDLGRLLELCKEQKHLTGQEVVQHQHEMYVLHKERGDEELHLDMGTAARARGANTRSSRGTFGGYRYNSKTRRNAGKSGKKKKKGTRRKRRRKRR